MPGLCHSDKSYLMHILDTIDQRMRNASEIMLPALRRSLHSFTRRADIIIRQISYMNSHNNSNLVEICKELSDIPESEYAERMNAAAELMATMNVQFVDPKQVRLNERKQKQWVDSSVHEQQNISQEALRDLMIQQLLDQAIYR